MELHTCIVINRVDRVECLCQVRVDIVGHLEVRRLIMILHNLRSLLNINIIKWTSCLAEMCNETCLLLQPMHPSRAVITRARCMIATEVYMGWGWW